MDRFEALFGTAAGAMGKCCLLLPVVTREMRAALCLPRLSRGALYGCGRVGGITVVRTGTGPAPTGDAVLHLAESPCRNVLLFGSCGSAGGPGTPAIGDLVCPPACIDPGGFPSMLRGARGARTVHYANSHLHAEIMKAGAAIGVRAATCFSTASLRLEEDTLGFLREGGAEVFDMECASVFAAARVAGLRAAALLHVTDVVGESPFYVPREPAQSAAIREAVERGLRFLCELMEERLCV